MTYNINIKDSAQKKSMIRNNNLESQAKTLCNQLEECCITNCLEEIFKQLR